MAPGQSHGDGPRSALRRWTCAPPGGLPVPPLSRLRLLCTPGSSVSTSALYCAPHNALHPYKRPLPPGGL